MKRVTLLVEMRCNNFCVYCGARAIDPAMIESRKRNGLTVPAPPSPAPVQRIRRALRVLAHRAGIADHPGAPVRGGTFEAFTLEHARTVLAERRAEGYDAVHFQGGEPTLWPALPEAVAAARQLGYRDVSVVSNGRQLTDIEFARTLVRAGLTSVQLSLLGHDAATHDAVTLVPGSFDSLVRAMTACVAVRDADAPSLRVSCNVITSAETHAHLAEQVTLVARLGIRDATVHLVRFDLFGDDPTVRRRMAFPIESIRASLVAAAVSAEREKFTLQLDDVPMCFHPAMKPDDVARTLDRAADGVVHAVGPYDQIETGSPRPRRMPRACDGCVFVHACGYVPAEYVDGGAERAVKPVTLAAIRERLEREPRGDGALRRIESIAASVVVLAERGVIDHATEADLLGASRDACGRALMNAIDADDELEALRALHGAIGLRSPQEERATGRLAMARGTQTSPPVSRAGPNALSRELRQFSGEGVDTVKADAVAGVRSVRNPVGNPRRLELPGGSAVRFTGHAQSDGVFDVRSVELDAPANSVPGGDRAIALLAVLVRQSLAPARRVRFVDGTLDVDLGSGWRRFFVPVAPDGLRWRTE